LNEEYNIYNYDLILLDLRLFGENEKSIDLDKISGKKLLELLRKDFSGIPILISTASNKIWSYEKLMKLGADAYWIKEGIDSHFDAEETTQNYHKLLWLINQLTSKEYQFIKTIYHNIREIELNEDLWWKKEIIWENGERYSLDNSNFADIIICLKHVAEKYRTYLKQFRLGLYYVSDELSERQSGAGWQLKSIINDLGIIFEIIHQTVQRRVNTITIGGRIENNIERDKNRGDWVAQLMYYLRNKASHNSES